MINAQSEFQDLGSVFVFTTQGAYQSIWEEYDPTD